MQSGIQIGNVVVERQLAVLRTRRAPVDQVNVEAGADQEFDQALPGRQVEDVRLADERHHDQQRHAIDVVGLWQVVVQPQRAARVDQLLRRRSPSRAPSRASSAAISALLRRSGGPRHHRRAFRTRRRHRGARRRRFIGFSGGRRFPRARRRCRWAPVALRICSSASTRATASSSWPSRSPSASISSLRRKVHRRHRAGHALRERLLLVQRGLDLLADRALDATRLLIMRVSDSLQSRSFLTNQSRHAFIGSRQWSCSLDALLLIAESALRRLALSVPRRSRCAASAGRASP